MGLGQAAELAREALLDILRRSVPPEGLVVRKRVPAGSRPALVGQP